MSHDSERLLILLIGIPGSGKSSLAAKLQQAGGFLVATDQIRAALFGDASIQGDWRLIWQAVEQQLRVASSRITSSTINCTTSAQKNPDLTAPSPAFVVYDATNTRRRARREMIRLARSLGYNRIVGLWLNPPLSVCLARNQQRPRQVPEAVIQRMHRQLWSAPPKLCEGLDLLLHYGGTMPFDPEDWLRQILLEPSLGRKPEANSGARPDSKYGNCTRNSAKTEPGSTG